MAGPQQPTLIVDAWNVLHVTGVLPPGLAGMDLPALARLIAASRWGDRWACLVCDGPGPGGGGDEGRLTAAGAPRVEVRYVGAAREADAEIEAMIDRHTAPARAMVVSSDRRVRAAARRRRAAAMKSDTFLRRLLDDLGAGRRGDDAGRPGGAVDADEVAAWMREMGYTPPAGAGQNETGPADPLIREALKEWADRLDADDLNMDRWLDDPPDHEDRPR